VGIEEDSSEAILGPNRCPFIPEVTDCIGTTVFVKLQTKDGKYLRHSNYLIRADEYCENDRPLLQDSMWVFKKRQGRSIASWPISTAPSTPHSTACQPLLDRPLFIHVDKCFKDEDMSRRICKEMDDYIETYLLKSKEKPRSERIPGAHSDDCQHKGVIYSLQGAGGMSMDARATAISTYRPDGEMSEHLRDRIEQATTVRSRGGVQTFLTLPDPIAKTVSRLEKMALARMKKMKMFGMITRRSFELTLGFCEWVTLPHGSDIVPHRDGGNDCDVAAIFAFKNQADVTVEGTTVRLGPGQMYIFEPQKYTHSVSKPIQEGPRHVIALRFFRTYN